MKTEVHAMPTLTLRFPGGRYHATPWGHHINEGLVEWPPSPWRLLRAFLACGFSTQHWVEVPPIARRLLDKLAAVLPSYRLPDTSAAHSRHFMPIGVLAKGREQTTLVFDTWANVGDGELLINWPCELDADESTLFEELASALGYLGRSESWVEAQVSPDFAGEWDATPCAENEQRGPGWEQVSLMAAITPSDYASWRAERVAHALATVTLPKTRKQPNKADRNRAEEPYPPDLVSCLSQDTAQWKQHGWSQPPGSQRVLYWRRNGALEVGTPRKSTRRSVPRVEVFLLALTTASGRMSALPPCSRTLPQAEMIHRALVSRVAKGHEVYCPELTGRDELRRPLRHSHQHAHVLPVDLDCDGRIDHVLIYAPMRFGSDAQLAIRSLRRTWTKGSDDDLQLAVAGSGALDDLRELRAPLAARVVQVLGPVCGARTWVSATPLVLPRHLKPRGANSFKGQLNAELSSRELPPVLDFEVLRTESVAMRHFVRRRQRGGVAPANDVGYAVRLQFAQPLCGPLVLGYASHFGLGMFYAEEE